jgi:hypothetical protein
MAQRVFQAKTASFHVAMTRFIHGQMHSDGFQWHRLRRVVEEQAASKMVAA